MPKTLTPVNAFPTSIPNFPMAGNNEPVAIGPLEAAIQAVLDRTENLHQSRLTVEGAGIKRIQRVASLTALQNLAGMSDGDTVDVEGYGRYRLYNPSALTADGLWVLNAAGGGRWVHTLRDMRGAGNGLATLDSSQRLAQDVRDASILTQHIANQAVTAAKLAPGSVVGHLGYTPLNKAGDTMTGDLTVQGLATLAGRAFRKVSFVPTNGVGWYRIVANANVFGGRLDIYAEWNAQVSRITLEGHSAGYDNMGYFNATQVFQYSGGLITQIRWGQSGGFDAYLDIYVASVTNNSGSPVNLYFWGDAWTNIQTSPAFNAAAGMSNTVIDVSQNGVLQARYDHQNRFVVSAFAGQDIAVSGNSFTVLGRIFVTVPSGRSLYVRRVRAYFTGDFRARVAAMTGSIWVAGQAALDADINQSILTGPASQLVYVGADNVSGSSQTVQQGHGAMIELEIR